VITWVFGFAGSAWRILCVLFRWSYSLGPTRHTLMHGKGERKASKGLRLASCMDDTIVELVELGSG
jgi:hypothetical protein